MGNCFEKMNRFNDRCVKYAFDIWRTESNNSQVGRAKLIDFIKERVHFRARQALYKW